MRKRVHYVPLTYSIPEEDRQEVLENCGHCTCKLFLEGRQALGPAPAAPHRAANLGAAAGQPTQEAPQPAAAGPPAPQPQPQGGLPPAPAAPGPEGAPDGQAAPAHAAPPAPSAGPQRQADGQPAPKRPRTALECLRELQQLKELLDAGLLSRQEFEDLKGRLLRGD